MQNALQAAEQLSAALAEQAARQQQKQLQLEQSQAAHMNGFAQSHAQQQQGAAGMFQQSPKQPAAAPSSLILNPALYSLPPIPAAMRQLHPSMVEQHPQSIVHHNQHFYAPAPPSARHASASIGAPNGAYPFVASSPFALIQQRPPQLPHSTVHTVTRNSSTTSSTSVSEASSPTSSPSSSSNGSGVLNLFDLLEHMRLNISRIRLPTLAAQLAQQLQPLHDQMLLYRMRHERGEDMNREAHVVYREMRQFDEQISKHLTAQTEHDRLLSLVNFSPNTLHSNHTAVNLIKPIASTFLQQQQQQQLLLQQQLNGLNGQHLHTNGHALGPGLVAFEAERRREKEARAEKKRKRREGRERTEEEEADRRARKKKRRETEDAEAREGRKRKKEKRKAREARKEAQEKERLKEKKRKKHKSKHHTQNGHADSFSSGASSSSSASDSSDASSSSDDEAGGSKALAGGRKTKLSSSEKEQTVQALIASLYNKREAKKKQAAAKDSGRARQPAVESATPAAAFVTAAMPALAALTPSYRPPAFSIADFADAFRNLPTPPAMPAPFPPPAATTGQLICAPVRQTLHPPPRADDDRVVLQRSALLSAFAFSPDAVRGIMRRAMPASGECSEEAVQLVTTAVCQFIAYITDEAEADIGTFEEDDVPNPPSRSPGDGAAVAAMDEDELPLSRSLRPPPLESETGEKKEEQPMETVSTPAATQSNSSSSEISSEKVLDALLRLGYDDYAVLSAYHIQRYRRQQRHSNGPLSPVPRGHPLAAGSTREELPSNLSSSYLLANAHRIDMSRFLPSIPRHPVSDPRIELSVSSSTLASLPSSFTPSPSSHSASPASSASSLKKKPRVVDPSAPPKKSKGEAGAVSEAATLRGAQLRASWSKKRALMATGLTREQATERVRRERQEEKRAEKLLRQQQKPQKVSKKALLQQQRLSLAAGGEGTTRKVGSIEAAQVNVLGGRGKEEKERAGDAASYVESPIDLTDEHAAVESSGPNGSQV